MFRVVETSRKLEQMETRQVSSLTASVGTVAPNGPAGLGRPETITYQPSGFDPIFDAWTFTASSNNLTASFTTPAPRSMKIRSSFCADITWRQSHFK